MKSNNRQRPGQLKQQQQQQKQQAQHLREREEFHQFKRWLFSLDREALLDAMSFPFQTTAPTATGRTGGSGNRNGPSGASVVSHEYDLLLEMVQLQPPPPTPVHPRAMGYQPRASRWGARLDHPPREEGRLRWTRPRLFQWCGGGDEHPRQPQDSRLPSGRRGRPGGERQAPDRFHVVARKWVAPWGDCYSTGCTTDQREADVQIVGGTRLGRHRGVAGGGATAVVLTACFVDETMGRRHGGNDGLTSGKIIRMLQVASRGHFLAPFHQLSRTAIDRLGSPPFCAPWLRPTERWFSLSFYLASRYEVALWDSFRRQGTADVGSRQQPKAMPSPRQIRHGDWDRFDSKILHVALVRAVKLGMQDLLKSEQDKQLLDTEHNFLRDGVLWSIIEPSARQMIGTPFPTRGLLHTESSLPLTCWKATTQTWTQIPLFDVHSPMQTRFKSMVFQHLEEQAVAEMERQVCRAEELEGDAAANAIKVRGKTSGGTANIQTNRKMKRKKAKRSKQKEDRKMTPSGSPLPSIPASSDEGSATDGDDFQDDLEPHVAAMNGPPRETQSAVDFPKNLTSPRDRNRNIILVLGILDEVMECVYSTLGLPATPAFVGGEQGAVAAVDTSKATAMRKEEGGSAPTPRAPRRDQKRESGSPSATTAGVISRPQGFDQVSTNHFRDAQNPWRVPVSIDDERSLECHQRSDVSEVSTSTFYSRNNVGLPDDFYPHFVVERDLIFGQEPLSNTVEGEDSWSFVNRYQSRERSILTDFFRSRESTFDNGGSDDDDERLMAASTAASISSSNYKDTTLVIDIDDLEDDSVAAGDAGELVDTTVVVIEDSTFSAEMVAIREVEDDILSEESDHQAVLETNSVTLVDLSSKVIPARPTIHETESVGRVDSLREDEEEDQNEDKELAEVVAELVQKDDSSIYVADCRSPSPQAPMTPPPTLSPILVSLADLKDLQRQSSTPPGRISSRQVEKFPPVCGPGSLPSSPVPPHKNSLTTSWSREDLRIEAFRDDHSITQQRRQSNADRVRGSETPTYKSVAVKSLARPIASTKSAGVDFRSQVLEASLRKQGKNRDLCAQSETAAEGQREEHHPWHHDEAENHSMTRDETLTITSGISQKGESEELATIREERNAFRDMCLTLGAEVAKLRAMLSAQQAAAVAPLEYPDVYNHPMYRPGSFDPNGMQPFYHGINNGIRPGPMSDAGFHRGGDHESQFSDDELYDSISKVRDNRVDSIRRMSSSHTMGGSDASVDFNSSNHALTGGQAVGPLPVYDSVHVHGYQSRLAKDILRFLDASSGQLRKMDGRRKLAVERFSRLVKTIWPRSQVKLYGSYVSGLCLPSSDLDFVICLPAVHKKDLALAPGVLEGRNAINETSQKLLARELKGESWIDPRSIKLIERTVVPVIKVSTKDTRARMIQLDISFDSPEHHGLEANQMVAQILDELPLIRPLMLVLKQFLLGRGLLTAYTGGLSSYCLFLMVARYLQEQPPSSGDCGSLLMGFLDFYGNSFDPRVTGISVRRQQYFARANYAIREYERAGQRMWTHQPHQQNVVTNLPVIPDSPKDFRRHNSFSDTGSFDGNRRSQHFFSAAPTHRFVPRIVPPRPKDMDHHNPAARTTAGPSSFDHVRPFTFDPFFVEDPLSSGNNVGRNAFRINQVQRAFSDAHRALVASLEWDIPTSADGVQADYPLLKCLLQGEDVLYEL